MQGGQAEVVAVTSDAQRNLYALINYSGGLTFAGQSFLSVMGESKTVLVALDKDGMFLWARDLQVSGGVGGGTIKGLDIIYTGNAGLFLLGQATGATTIGSTVLTPANAGAYPRGFVAQIDTQGQWQGAVMLDIDMLQGTNNPEVQPLSLAVTPGEVWVAGLYSGKLSVGTMRTVQQVNQHAFLLQLDAQLNPVTLETSSSPNPQIPGGVDEVDMVIDNQGRVHLIGGFRGEILLGGFRLTPPSGQNFGTFVTQQGQGGTWNWRLSFARLSFRSIAERMLPLSSGGVLFAGAYRQAFMLGSLSVPAPTRTSAFLAAVDASGAVSFFKATESTEDSETVSLSRRASGDIAWVLQGRDTIKYEGRQIVIPFFGGSDFGEYMVLFVDEQGMPSGGTRLPLNALTISGLESGERRILPGQESALVVGALRGDVTYLGQTYQRSGIKAPILLRVFY